ncbi:hypothetical protein Q1B87_001293 [Salmonella enterica]
MKIPRNISVTSFPVDSFTPESPVNLENTTLSAPGRLKVIRNMTSPTKERLNLYTRLVNQKNTTEDFVG